MNLKGKNILITGASRGFGAELAKNLWKEGANLFLVSINKNWKNTTDDFVNSHDQQKIVKYLFDLADLFFIEEIYSEFFRQFDKIDALINNAAIQQPIGDAWEANWTLWERCLDVNLKAPIKLMKLFIPNMIDNKKGKIINMSGGGATGSRPAFSAYATSKAALVKFSEILADELKQRNIDVNCIAPGAMNTSMQEEVLRSENSPDKDIRVAEETLTKTNTMDKPIALVKWLLSEKSDGITGKLISAVWDDWKLLEDKSYSKNLYTLRRVDYA